MPFSILPIRKMGWMDYNDTSTSTTPVILAANTWTDVPNDGLGAFTNKGSRPIGVTELLDTSTGHIDPTELGIGDVIFFRFDIEVTPDTNNQLYEFRLALGTGAGSYTLPTIKGRLDSGSGNPYRYSLTVDSVYMGDLNTRDNPIIPQIRTSGSGQFVNAGVAIIVHKL